MLEFYFDFYVQIYGRRCCALHDPLTAAIASGQAIPSYAPMVPVEVDKTNGPGRGQTIVDMRSQRAGPNDHEGVRTRVIFTVEGNFAEHLLETLKAADSRPMTPQPAN
jgi:purine nucleosidase